MSQAREVDPNSRRRRRRRRLAGILGVCLTVALLALRPLLTGNFGVVDPDAVYRSAQPMGNLDGMIRDYRLATVLNLRGGSFADPFYADEVRVTRERGVDFYDLMMSANRRPTRRELLLLLDFFEHCRYPLLIHCKSGADRTGLASGLYLMARRGESPEEAIRALTLQYGHYGLGGTEHLHEPFYEYAAWLERGHLTHTPRRLREWVEAVYASPEAGSPFRPLRPGPRETLSARSSEGQRASTRR